MTTSSGTRGRAGLVVAASAAAFLTATSMAVAHEGTVDENILHGCVNEGSGVLHVVSATGPDCRPNETPVHWPLESGDADQLAEFMQRLLDGDNPDDLVHWNNVAGVPESLTDALSGWLADGVINYDEITGVLTADSVDGSIVRNGTLTSDDIWDDTIISADIANGSLTGEDIADGTLTAGDLAGSDAAGVVPGAVTSEKILDATVQGRDLATGAVTPDKTRPVVQSGSGSALLPLVTPQSLPPSGVTVGVSPGSLVMVSGQVQVRLACSACVPNAEYVVEYQVVRDGTPVGPEYRLELSQDHRFDVASVSVLDSGFTLAASPVYAIRLEMASAGVDVTATDAVLTAQVLGVE